MRNWLRVLCLIGLLMVPTLVRADVVIDWNNIALGLLKDTNTKPPHGSRILAMTQAAVYDSVNAIYNDYEVYVVSADPPENSSPQAAAATAAHDVLLYAFPDEKCYLDRELAKSLSSVQNREAKNNGIALGRYVAKEIIEWRSNDGSNRYVPYRPGHCPGQWRPTLPSYAPALDPNWPYVETFVIPSAHDYTPGPPPSLTSRAYADAVNQVAKVGELNSRCRTKDQTEIAWFWADDSNSVTPPGRWNIIAQIAAERMHNTIEENARLFALINVAMADAAISCWNCKYKYNLWRPITAIREADTDGNPLTMPIPGWTPLLPTPPFPAYTSGHSTFGAASAEILIRFYGSDNFRFLLASDTPLAHARFFRSWSEAAEENGISRIYGGIHYSFDNTQGLYEGQRIGDYTFENVMQPL